MSDHPDHDIREETTRAQRAAAPRRLVAIMMADIVGYSTLTQRDERGTHNRVERIRHEILVPTILEYNGTMRKQRGDGFLVTFDSPVECVRAAIIIQQRMVGDNLERSEGDWIRFRIGINLGDVIMAPDDIYGDGVNVAARLEAMAPAGGILISGGVHEQVRYKLVCGYEALGDRKLKNIQDPIAIWRVLPDPSAIATVEKQRKQKLIRQAILVAGAAGLTLVVGGGAGWFLWPRQQEPAVIFSRQEPPRAPTPTPIPTSPVIAPQNPPPSVNQTPQVTPPPAPPVVPDPPTKPPPTQVAPPPPPPPKPLPQQQDALVVKPTPAPAPSLPPELPRLKLPDVAQVSGGSFQMGSTEDPSEQPVHAVSVSPFLIGKDVVLVGEWRQCVQAQACSYVPRGDDDQPLGNVSWNDTQQYLKWLSDLTHHQWRLPTEAEWEYAARGGSKTRFWWGDAMKPGMAICRGCGDKPIKVAANAFGLTLNDGLSEWVEDCWVKDYHGAPANGSARVMPDCHDRVLRGASASNDQSYARPASRGYYDASVRYPTHGFRVAASQ